MKRFAQKSVKRFRKSKRTARTVVAKKKVKKAVAEIVAVVDKAVARSKPFNRIPKARSQERAFLLALLSGADFF